MQIHELNNYVGELDGNAYVAVDNGTDTGKVSTAKMLANVNAEIEELDTFLNARIDNIIAGGAAPSEAEIIDARLGADNETYSSLGAAIRNQVDDLKSAIAAISGTELILFSDPSLKQYINTSGATVDWSTPTTASTDLFKWAVVNCTEGDVFTINGQGGSSGRLWAFADSSKNILEKSSANLTASNLVLVAPANAAYLIINDKSNNLSYKGMCGLWDGIDDTNNEIDNVKTALRIVSSANKLNPNAVVRGKAIFTDGSLVDNSSYFASDFIPCNGGDVFYYVRKNDNGIYLDANVNHLAQYTVNKRLIRRDDYVHTRTLESDCAFIRVDNPQTQIDAAGAVASVTFNSVPTTGDEIQAWFAPYIYLTANRFDAHVADFDSYKNEVSVLARPENELNLSDILLDTLVSSDGTESYNDTCFTTNYFIPAEYGDVVTYAWLSNGGDFYHKAVNLTNIVMYDADKVALGSSGFFKNDFVINQADCKFIRVSVPNAALNARLASVSINAIPTKASITQYKVPYYSATKPSAQTVRNRKVLWLGTSIPTYGYPQILARLCGCNMHNEAIGSSGITQGITSRITDANVCGINSIWGLYGLTQTIAEKQAMINNWSTIASEIGSADTLTDDIKNIALASSYETIVDPYLTGDDAVDLIVINHGYNDNNENAIAPAGDKLNPHYLEGAYNWLIKHILEAKPTMGIVIFGHYSDLPDNKEVALQNVADRWNIPYYLLKDDLAWSNVQTINTTKKVNSSGEWETITATDMTVQAMWLGDGVHPLGVATKRIAQVSQNVFADWLKMYCDPVE